MRSFELEHWDDGRLTVNREFGALLKSQRLTTASAIWEFSQCAEPVKALRTDRVTLRFLLTDADGSEREFYIKRHGDRSWWECIKPWLQRRRLRCGARMEWEALLAFHRNELPTMTPVAWGMLGDRSFVITQGLEGCRKLSAVFPAAIELGSERRRMILQTAMIARQMHASGLHHQDFYLGHLLERDPQELYVIDLGRVRAHSRLFARRWIIKDLAQLNFSARDARLTERMRFLRAYLGRRLQASDRMLVQSITAKSRRIARHTAKHGL